MGQWSHPGTVSCGGPDPEGTLRNYKFPPPVQPIPNSYLTAGQVSSRRLASVLGGNSRAPLLLRMGFLDWLSTYSHPPASASQVLGSQNWATLRSEPPAC